MALLTIKYVFAIEDQGIYAQFLISLAADPNATVVSKDDDTSTVTFTLPVT